MTSHSEPIAIQVADLYDLCTCSPRRKPLNADVYQVKVSMRDITTPFKKDYRIPVKRPTGTMFLEETGLRVSA